MEHVPPRTRLRTAHSVARVERLRWGDEPRAGAMLARSFLHDPLVIAICGATPVERLRRMEWAFRVALRSHWLAGQPTWTMRNAGGEPAGIVLASRSPAAVRASSDLTFAVRGLVHVGWRATARGIRAAAQIAAHAPPPPFTYLKTLGVSPDLQRTGIGSALVEHVLRSAPPGEPVYLETANELNLGFYQRHHFRCIGEFRCLGVPIWRLLSEPQPAGAVTGGGTQ